MKKILSIIAILLLTGCVKEKVICTLNSEYSETGIIREELTGMFNGDNELVDMEMTYNFVSTERASEMCDLFEMANEYQEKSERVKFKCDDESLTITSYKGVLNNLKIQENEIMHQTKDQFINIISQKGFVCN